MDVVEDADHVFNVNDTEDETEDETDDDSDDKNIITSHKLKQITHSTHTQVGGWGLCQS